MEASCNDENVLKKQYTLRFDLWKEMGW
jgi:hypothetical protein